MAQQVYAWPEGQVAIWTGAGASSAVFTYAQNTTVTLTYGWMKRQVGDASYHAHVTGQQAAISVAAARTYSNAIVTMAEAKTAVHMKFIHSGIHGTAGYTFYSGQLLSVTENGSENSPFTYTIAGDFNLWSAFGGT